MGNAGVKIFDPDRPGTSVLTQLPRHLKWLSGKSTLKIVKTGDIQVTTNGSGNGTTAVAHGLPWIPAYFHYRKMTVNWPLLDASSYANSFVPDPGQANQWGGDYHKFLHVYTDATNVYLQAKDAEPSTTYTVHYILLVDLAEEYSGDDLVLHNNVGIKFSKNSSIDVRTAKQFELSHSSAYKAIQYYDVNYKTTTLTLPPVFASSLDTFQEEGTYVDILHGLTFPPMFLGYADISQGYVGRDAMIIPFAGIGPVDDIAYGVGAFCDATRVRLSFYRNSRYGFPGAQFLNSETITLRCWIFTEDLTATFSAI